MPEQSPTAPESPTGSRPSFCAIALGLLNRNPIWHDHPLCVWTGQLGAIAAVEVHRQADGAKLWQQASPPQQVLDVGGGAIRIGVI